MPTLRSRRYEYLINAGFNHKESLEYSRQYDMLQLHSIPYLTKMIRSRRLFRDFLRSRGYTDRNIQGAIANLYYRNDWRTPEGKFDPWKMLKRYRNEAIESGDYAIPQRKGSHHKTGVSKGDIKGQRTRRHDREKKMTIGQLMTELSSVSEKMLRTGDMDEYNKLATEKSRLERRISQY